MYDGAQQFRTTLVPEQLPIDRSEDQLLLKQQWQRAPWSYLLAVLCVAVMTGLIYIMQDHTSMAIIPMLYLIAVTVAAFFLGSLPAVVSSVLAFLAFDWFFVEPRYQFTVQDPTEWLALCMFLLTATLTGQLTALLRSRAEEAQRRKLETAALAEASWAVASEIDRDRAMNKIISQLAHVISPDYVAVLLQEPDGGYRTTSEYSDPNRSVRETSTIISLDAVKAAMAEGRANAWMNHDLWEEAHSEAGRLYLPILLDHQDLGLVVIKPKPEQSLSSSQRQVVSSLLNHAAVILQRDKLMKAEARAQALAEADKLKTALLSMVSHDFRSPLTSIKASVSSLLEEGSPPDAEEQRALLQAVDHEADRLNKMVGNILDLSRLEAGAWGPRKETTEVAELIGSALDSFDAQDNARIDVKIAPEIHDLIADSVQMVQVVRNLIENALKYSQPLSPVELSVLVQDGAVVIEVADRGGGLPKGDEEKIFESFYRAPRFGESSIPGVGIGLALCRGLVEANGGVLTAANREGGGAVFRVTLPSSLCPDLLLKPSP